MSDEVKKDVIVVAREGYSVLLEIDGRIFDIDCHTAVNLSNIFSAAVLENCSSLSTHLRDGNLVLFDKDTVLLKDTAATAAIVPLREETAQHITAQYDQAERDVSRTNMELETRSNITENTRKRIQDQVQAGKETILRADQKKVTKIVKDIQTTNEVNTPLKERQTAMDSNELILKVSMDVSPAAFAKRQAMSRNILETTEEADEMRAEREIKKQDDAR